MGKRDQRDLEVDLIGVPSDFGANQRGVGMAPMAFRLAGLKERAATEEIVLRDLGDIPIPPEGPRPGPRNLFQIKKVSRRLADLITRSLETGRLPISIGGDHSIAIGSVAGAARHFRAQGKKMGLLWVDAHGDMNTPETSPSGNIHGMPLAISLGEGYPDLVNLLRFSPKVEAARCALIGIRNLDQREKDNIARFGIKVLTMKEIDRRGIASVLEEAIGSVSNGIDGLHVSFDMDVVDPRVAPGVGTPVPGGLSYREAHLIMEMVFDSGAMTSLDLVEANPIIDVRNSTADLGVELILSALGKSIY
jgi:arginase